MKTGIVAILCLLILGSLATNIQSSNSQEDNQTAKIEQMIDFLTNRQFNETVGLCREAPDVAPNTYWLVSDNLWAWKALSIAGQANLSNSEKAEVVADKIESKLKELTSSHSVPVNAQGLPKSYFHETIIGDAVPRPNKTAINSNLYKADYELNITVCDGAEMADWEQYGDRLLVAALSSHWQGNDVAALDYYNSAVNMWNETSQGMQDNATSTNYAVYKLALLLYTSRLLGEQLPFEQTIVDRLYYQQESNPADERYGGIRTDYYADGAINGDTNTETTAIVIIALLTPQAHPSKIPWEILAVAVIIGSVVIAMVAFKRPFQHFSRRTQR